MKNQAKKEKKLEKDAVQKLGINNLEDLLEYFEESEKLKFLSMFQITKVLGTGGFGVVVAAKD